MGWCVLFFPGRMDALSFFVGTEEKRAVGQSENEPALKGARTPLWSPPHQHLPGPPPPAGAGAEGPAACDRTAVPHPGHGGLSGRDRRPDTVKRVEEKLDAIDIDGVESAREPGGVPHRCVPDPLSPDAVHPAAGPVLSRAAGGAGGAAV